MNLNWPDPERFHARGCAWVRNCLCPCDCGGEDYMRRMEERHEFIIENNRREAIVEMSDYGVIRWCDSPA